MPEFKKDDGEIGALLAKQGPKGEYFTGVISGVNVVVFRNTRKAEGSKQPDFRVLLAKPREERAPAQRDNLDGDIAF